MSTYDGRHFVNVRRKTVHKSLLQLSLKKVLIKDDPDMEPKSLFILEESVKQR